MPKKWIAALAATLALAGCASPPGRIQPTPIAASVYSGKSCAELRADLARVQAQYNKVAREQSNTATGDAIGVFLIAVPLGSVTGGDHKSEVAEAKGRLLAIRNAMTRKGCGS